MLGAADQIYFLLLSWTGTSSHYTQPLCQYLATGKLLSQTFHISTEITRMHCCQLLLGQTKFAITMQKLQFVLLHFRDKLFICELDLHCHFTANLKNQGNTNFGRCIYPTGLQPGEEVMGIIRLEHWVIRLTLNGTTHSVPPQTSNSTKLHISLENL